MVTKLTVIIKYSPHRESLSKHQNRQGRNKGSRNLNKLKRFLLVVLLTLHTDINDLQDVVISTELQSSNIDLNIIFKEIFSQLANLFGPGSAPHQGLTVRLQKEDSKITNKAGKGMTSSQHTNIIYEILQQD